MLVFTAVVEETVCCGVCREPHPEHDLNYDLKDGVHLCDACTRLYYKAPEVHS